MDPFQTPLEDRRCACGRRKGERGVREVNWSHEKGEWICGFCFFHKGIELLSGVARAGATYYREGKQ